MALKLKTVVVKGEDGAEVEYGVLSEDGKPLYVNDTDGKETAVDAEANRLRIAALNKVESDSRHAIKEANEKLAAYAGIEDPAEALKGIQFMASMEGKKVMDDDGIQKLVQASVKPFVDQLAERDKVIAERDGQLYKEQIGKGFAMSEFIKSTIWKDTPEDAELKWGKNFTIENGQKVGRYDDGRQILDAYGAPADFETALATLVESHPKRDHYKLASGGGSGAQQSTTTKTADAKTITRAEFTAKSPAEQSELSIARVTITD